MSIYSEHISPEIHRRKAEVKAAHDAKVEAEREAVRNAPPEERVAYKADGTRVVSAPPSPSIKAEPKSYRMQARPRS
jgi:hypothetical protein